MHTLNDWWSLAATEHFGVCLMLGPDLLPSLYTIEQQLENVLIIYCYYHG